MRASQVTDIHVMAAVVDSKGKPLAFQSPRAGKFSLGRFLWRLIWVPGMLRVLRQAKKNRAEKVALDAELRLYSQMLPNGYLHYGYFENASVKGEEISFDTLSRAQQNYADRLVDLIEDQENPVLDVGCGMGGISYLLLDSGYDVVSLTPDRHQAAHIRKQRPGHTVIENTFEGFEPVAEDMGRYGTLLTSESLQYLDLEESLPKIKALLKPGGRWVACDYFCLSKDDGTSGHHWDSFVQALKAHGLQIRFQEDITDHVMPTLRFAGVLANRFLNPAWDYVGSKVQTKKPGIHYLLEDLFGSIDSKIDRAMQTLDEQAFKRKKKYVLLAIEAETA